MNIKHILILIIFTVSYTNKNQCMLSEPIRKSNCKKKSPEESPFPILEENLKQNQKNENIKISRYFDHEPLQLQGVLKGHGDWIAQITNNQKK